MDYDKLIEQAKNDAKGSHPVVPSWAAIVDKKQLKEYATAIETLRADLARVTAERDAAVEELENYMVQDVVEGNEPCGICAKASATPCECCDPKWRGIQED